MNVYELEYHGLYLYANYPYQCEVELLTQMLRSDIGWEYQFKVVGRVKYFDDCEEELSDEFYLTAQQVENRIYCKNDILYSFEDL